jgi:tRNA nucleotidyltransferase/poly(A) polymerase
MSNVLEEFKKEHETVLNLLKRIKRLGVHTMEGRNQLIEAKDQLCIHMKKQFMELYPELKKSAETDAKLQETIKNYEKEMKNIVDFCAEFFDKYSISGGGIEFLRDFEKLKRTLESRIQDEEGLLDAIEN